MNKANRNNHFILGSTSKRRVNLLKQIGIKPNLILSPNIDESKRDKELPLHYVRRMAIEKNKAFQSKYSNSIILTADTIVCVGTRLLPKTVDLKKAENSLNLISGRRHKVYTSFAIYIPNCKLKVKTVKTIVKFKRLHEEEIKYSLKTNEWLGKAGSYAIQGIAASFINFLSGSYSNVVGLPLAELYRTLLSVGYNFRNVK